MLLLLSTFDFLRSVPPLWICIWNVFTKMRSHITFGTGLIITSVMVFVALSPLNKHCGLPFDIVSGRFTILSLRLFLLAAYRHTVVKHVCMLQWLLLLVQCSCRYATLFFPVFNLTTYVGKWYISDILRWAIFYLKLIVRMLNSSRCRYLYLSTII